MELKNSGHNIIVVEQTTGSTLLTEMDWDVSKRTAIVFGNEVKGVQQKVVDMADICLEIPQMGTKHSLNVSVSAGIILWSLFKEKRWS